MSSRAYSTKKLIIVSLLLLVGLSQCKESGNKRPINPPNPVDVGDEYDFVFKDIRTYIGEPIKAEYANKQGNEYSSEKVALGQRLYNEKRLSVDNTVSCATCHSLDKGGTDNLANSVGINGQIGDRNAPTVINAALHSSQFWDGRAADVEEQAGGPILNPIEMGMPNKDAVEQKIREIEEYQALFKRAFPNETNPITFDNITKAIAAFERTLIQPSRFDRFLAGDIKALNNKDKKGLYLIKSYTCTSCHSTNLMGGKSFRSFGDDASVRYWVYTHSKPNAKGEYDTGRYKVTKKEEDKYVFKVPSWRNVEKTFPYFHDGSVAELSEVIRIMGKVQRNKDLNNEEVEAIEAFLKTLTSEKVKKDR